MNFLQLLLDFVVNQVLRELSLFLSLIVLLGCLFLKRSASDTLVSVLKTIVGVRILQIGSNVLVEASKPMMDMLITRFGIQGRLADPWTGVGEIFERMDPALVGKVGLLMLIAWLLHLLLSRFTPIKVIYLTGQVAFIDTVFALWGVVVVTGWQDVRAFALAALLLALYWWSCPKLLSLLIKDLVKDDPVTLGHDLMLGSILAILLAKVGDKNHSAEDIKFPGWLSIFSESVVAYGLVMGTLYTLIGIVVGPQVGALYSGGMHPVLFSFMQGINVAVGIVVLVMGVRMFLAELIPAFEGFAKKVIPGAIAAVDIPVFMNYAPQSALLGFISTMVGMLVGIGLQLLLNSTYVTIPSIFTMFFGGSVLGVFANMSGGWKGALFATFMLGVFMIFGGAWFAQVADLHIAAGGHLDYALYWTPVLLLLKAISH
ncbi:MAG: hypothetical protein GYA52_13160 [Chloroflexi bacterium]|nr:hypothetical protein [Chloroflexota bacterium]